MSSSKGYQFSISGNTVTAVYEVKNGRMKAERMDSDESWSFDGTHVIKSEMDDGRLEITTYADVDKDGLFFETGKTYSASGSPSWGGQVRRRFHLVRGAAKRGCALISTPVGWSRAYRRWGMAV